MSGWQFYMMEQELVSSSLKMVVARLKESLKLFPQLLRVDKVARLLSVHSSACRPLFLSSRFISFFGSTRPVTVTFFSLKFTSYSSISTNPQNNHQQRCPNNGDMRLQIKKKIFNKAARLQDHTSNLHHLNPRESNLFLFSHFQVS